MLACRGENAEVVASRSARVKGRVLEHGANLGARPVELVVETTAEGRRPPVGRTSPSSARSVVLLPAPFGPRKPVTRPASTSKLSPLTAWTFPTACEDREFDGGHVAA